MPTVQQITPNKTQLLNGSPVQPSSAFNKQSLTLGTPNATVAAATATFSSNQSTDQSIATAAKPDKVKTAKFEDLGVSVIDVVSRYDWTLSKNRKALVATIPYIKLREFDIVASNVATSLYASMGAVSDVLAANKDVIAKTANTLGVSEESQKSVAQGMEKITGTVSNVIPVQLKQEKYGPEWSEDLKRTYSNLYLRKATDVVYKLPYFTKDMVNISSSFADSADAGATSMTSKLFGGAAESIAAAVKAGTTLPSLVEPGVYIERPKFYQFGSASALISFSFTLFNTVSEDSYKKNSDLIKKLLLKNLPQRVDKVVVYPPAIYEVTIPGRAFYPYCYIDHLSITHEGTKRIISIDGGDEIIPDAYVVRIDMKSLTSDTNNFYVTQTGNAGIDFNQRRVTPDFTEKRADTKPLNTVTLKSVAQGTGQAIGGILGGAADIAKAAYNNIKRVF
jgi:hypothetical protein